MTQSHVLQALYRIAHELMIFDYPPDKLKRIVKLVAEIELVIDEQEKEYKKVV